VGLYNQGMNQAQSETIRKHKIGIFAPSTDDQPAMVVRAAVQIGRMLGEHAGTVTIITGGCSGLPYVVAAEAAKIGTEVWGFSPVSNRSEQTEFAPNDDQSIYTRLEFVPADSLFEDSLRARMKYRNVISTFNCDAGIIISGKWGSLNEFTNLIDMGKTVGVLTGTSGIADELPALTQKISKPNQGKIIFDSDPQSLVEKLLASL
jgi:predicted Rossmann-fold nucleotide-binding protein